MELARVLPMELLEVKLILLVLVGQAVSVNFRSDPDIYGAGRNGVRYLGESGKEYYSDYDSAISASASAPHYDRGAGYGQTAFNHRHSRDNHQENRFNKFGHFSEVPHRPNFIYRVSDGEDNVHYRSEQRDPNENVMGTYGYTNSRDLYRLVEYVADGNGYRANIRTKEPGTDGRKNPANVQILAEEPPHGIYELPVRPPSQSSSQFQPTRPQVPHRPQSEVYPSQHQYPGQPQSRRQPSQPQRTGRPKRKQYPVQRTAQRRVQQPVVKKTEVLYAGKSVRHGRSEREDSFANN